MDGEANFLGNGSVLANEGVVASAFIREHSPLYSCEYKSYRDVTLFADTQLQGEPPASQVAPLS